jgi:hypothetical protein
MADGIGSQLLMQRTIGAEELFNVPMELSFYAYFDDSTANIHQSGFQCKNKTPRGTKSLTAFLAGNEE